MNTAAAMVNFARCEGVAQTIKNLRLRNDFYGRPYLQHFADTETLLRMHFFAVAICHQTHNLFHRKLKLFGWDYLEHVFVKLASEDSTLLNPRFLADQNPDQLVAMLKPEFSHDGNPENCTLDHTSQRIELMVDASKKLIDSYNGKVAELVMGCDGFLLNQGKGLYEVLPHFEAFTDPLQKKSTFLIKLLVEAGLLEIKDTQHFIPIMDYHMQRVLLRLGCVEILDEKYRAQIVGREILETDEPIRSLCVEAFKLIATKSGHAITKMNDFFWSLGRSCCHETMLCVDHFCEKTPCTFTQIVELQNHDTCAFVEICPGASGIKYRELWQPVVETHFY